MSTQAQREVPSGYLEASEERGTGWVQFAGVLLLLLGTLNVIDGIAAIGQAHFYVGNAHYIFGDLKTWGWFMLALGIIQCLAAFAVWRGEPWARWFGVGVASVNAILQTMWIPAYPILAMTILTIDVIVIYGLLAYGGRRRQYKAAQERERVAVAR
jgi:uncharacterized membrane protein HdeD (DUF308 family)